MTSSKNSAAKPFVGRWRITEMETWPQDFVDLLGPGYIAIRANGSGEFRFGAVLGYIDYRAENGSDGARMDFTWDGEDENDPVSGRGWAFLRDGQLQGRLFIHNADESGFVAKKE